MKDMERRLRAAADWARERAQASEVAAMLGRAEPLEYAAHRAHPKRKAA